MLLLFCNFCRANREPEVLPEVTFMMPDQINTSSCLGDTVLNIEENSRYAAITWKLESSPVLLEHCDNYGLRIMEMDYLNWIRRDSIELLSSSVFWIYPTTKHAVVNVNSISQIYTCNLIGPEKVLEIENLKCQAALYLLWGSKVINNR